ncbi:SseB family protein [Brachybacterium sp. NBEC-018]|uniref:SseB family protein n=1 Tax=Brachybacterium sp. NBEC-018 TaxID=2996004 RepID=UPI00217500B5|nr:SseB family protein [Brachybacterium sp. NBEC-018]UVY85641.1 SseB family protein [Brachybacterium sp. NBEC-018]
MTSPQDPAPSPARRDLPAHFVEKSPLTDTAGVPWKGRDYAVSPFPGDDGSTPADVAAALAAHRAGEDPHRRALVAAIAGSRLLVPIMAVATEEGETAHGLTGDNGADMAMVSLTAPDGSRVLPVFTSAAALSAWRREARPVPVLAAQAAQAAVQEGCTSLLLDASASDVTAADGGPIQLPRSVLWALAQGRAWIPPHEDPELAAELDAIAAAVPSVLALAATPGERTEVVLRVRLEDGLDRDGVQAVVTDLSARLGASTLVAERISSLTLALGR